MSLVSFHRVLILIAIAFCLGFAGWELQAMREGAGSSAAALAVIFTVLALGLGVYLARLNAFLRIED